MSISIFVSLNFFIIVLNHSLNFELFTNIIFVINLFVCLFVYLKLKQIESPVNWFLHFIVSECHRIHRTELQFGRDTIFATYRVENVPNVCRSLV